MRCGAAEVEVNYKQQRAVGMLYIIPMKVDAVMGREWLRKFSLDWKNIYALQQDNPTKSVNIDVELQKILHKYSDVMATELRQIPNYTYVHRLTN